MGFRGPSARRVELLDAPSAGGGSAPPVTPVFDGWRAGLQREVLAHIDDFVKLRCAVELRSAGVDIAVDVLTQFVAGGKCLRSTFAYLGWLCGGASRHPAPLRATPDDAALRAAASFELLHAFALLQDDVMDGSALRRGRPAAHAQFEQWHRDRGLSGSALRFGESAATLLADLCLVWAAQMLRESGLPADALRRALPRYDAMRTELAVGQFADLVNDARGLPTLEAVLDVACHKSGNYTVRRPLEIGAAHQMADPAIRRQLAELMNCDEIDDAAIARCRTLIVATGAVQWIEEMIAERVTVARHHISDGRIDESVRAALADMAAVCTVRAA